MIKPKQVGVSEQVVTIKQAQNDALIIQNTSYELSHEEQEFEVQLSANVAFDVTPSVSWIHFVQTKALSNHSIVLKIDQNKTVYQREGKVALASKNGLINRIITVSQEGWVYNIADFKLMRADKTTWYELTGEIASIANETYGNLYIFDDTGYVYVYGLGEKQVASNDQSFSKLGLKVGDVVTMMTLRSEHNGLIEAGGQTPAYFVSKTAGSYKLGKKVSSTKAGWLELPATSASDGQDLLIHGFPDGGRNYAAYWDYTNLVASWVAYPLCAGNIGISGGRTDSFALDPLLPRDKQPYIPSAFKSGNASGSYDRGHQIPSADRLDWRVNLETFFGTNMTPKDNGLNGNAWGSLEIKVRDWAKNSATDTLYVVTGCTGADVKTKYVLDYDDKHIAIPAGYYKALLRLSKDKKYTALGIYYDNATSSDTNFKGRSMSIDELEKKVGVDFFVNLPEDVEKTVEAANPAEESWWWNN